MKKILYCMTLGIACLSFAFPLENNLKVITLNELIESDFFKELEKIPKENQEKYLFEQLDSKAIVFIKKGTILPFKIFLKGYFSLMNQESANLQIKVEKDLYIRLENNNFLFSENLKKWSIVSEFFTGNACINVGNKENQPQVEAGATLNKRN